VENGCGGDDHKAVRFEENLVLPSAVRFDVYAPAVYGKDNTGCKLHVGFRSDQQTCWMDAIIVEEEKFSYDVTFTIAGAAQDKYKLVDGDIDEYLGTEVHDCEDIFLSRKKGHFKFVLWDSAPEHCQFVKVTDATYLSYEVMTDKCVDCNE